METAFQHAVALNKRFKVFAKMVGNLEERVQAAFMEEKEEYEEISVVQMQEQNYETKMQYEIKLEDGRKRHDDELKGKFENQKRQII